MILTIGHCQVFIQLLYEHNEIKICIGSALNNRLGHVMLSSVEESFNRTLILEKMPVKNVILDTYS